MPYEKNKEAYQDDAYFERERRNILDLRNWNRDLIGQTFYSICGDNKNLYKEVRLQKHWITDGELDAMLSEPKPCPPPEGMKPAPEGALKKELRVKASTWQVFF